MIYVASSWRNLYQPEVVSALRGIGRDVYGWFAGKGKRVTTYLPENSEPELEWKFIWICTTLTEVLSLVKVFQPVLEV